MTIATKLIYTKAILFLVSGLLASALLLLDNPGLRTAFLLGVAVWCFARLDDVAFRRDRTRRQRPRTFLPGGPPSPCAIE